MSLLLAFVHPTLQPFPFPSHNVETIINTGMGRFSPRILLLIVKTRPKGQIKNSRRRIMGCSWYDQTSMSQTLNHFRGFSILDKSSDSARFQDSHAYSKNIVAVHTLITAPRCLGDGKNWIRKDARLRYPIVAEIEQSPRRSGRSPSHHPLSNAGACGADTQSWQGPRARTDQGGRWCWIEVDFDHGRRFFGCAI